MPTKYHFLPIEILTNDFLGLKLLLRRMVRDLGRRVTVRRVSSLRQLLKKRIRK